MMYINRTDPGYYMKRRFGKLVYELNTMSDRNLYRNIPTNKYTNCDGDFNSNQILEDTGNLIEVLHN